MFMLVLQLLGMVFWFIVALVVGLVMANDKAADKFYNSTSRIARIFSLNTLYALRWYIVMPFYWAICRLGMKFNKIDDQSPVRAYKYAMLGFDYSTKSVNTYIPSTCTKDQYRINYSTTDVARCRSGHNHPSPDNLCLCGFYGIKRRSLLSKIKGNWRPGRNASTQLFILEVEHYGKVVESIFGYRSEKQRVLKVFAKKRCAFCTIYCRHKPFYRRREAIGFAVYKSPFDVNRIVLPVCKKHSPKRIITIQDVADGLGTEVAWI